MDAVNLWRRYDRDMRSALRLAPRRRCGRAVGPKAVDCSGPCPTFPTARDTEEPTMTDERTETAAFTRMLQGLAIGAAAMYLLDPDKGRRRRALLRDRLNVLGSDIAELAHDAARDSANRLQGVRARVDRVRSGSDGSIDELRLIERVRAALGRVVSHPHAIQVGAMQGTVRLS